MKLDKEEIYFEFGPVTVGLANGLRRIILADVHTFAIDDVDITKNSSGFNIDYIKQRMHLLPIKSNQRDLIPKFKNECNCKEGHCRECGIVLTLDVIATKDKQKVTCSDFISGIDVSFTSDAMGIAIVVLMKGQRIKSKICVRKGIGHDHAKYIPATSVIVKPKAKITIQDDNDDFVTLPQKEIFVSKCPKNIFCLDDHHQIKIQNIDKCVFCRKCTDFAIEDLKLPSFVTVDKVPETFIVTIETDGKMRPELIFQEAIKIMKQKVTAIQF